LEVDAEPPDAQASRFFSEFCEQHHAKPVYLVCHGDESTAHYHFMLENLDRSNGRTISRDLHKTESSALQDHAGAVFSEIGISRGVKKLARIQRGESTSATIHRTVHELHTDLPIEIAALEAKRAKNQAYIDASQRALTAALDEGKAEKVRKRIANYEAHVAQIDQDIAQAMPAVHKTMIMLKEIVVSKSILKTVTETVEVALKAEIDRFAAEYMNAIRYLKSCVAGADERVDQREREAERLRKIVTVDFPHLRRRFLACGL
jgi:hypothetical protein